MSDPPITLGLRANWKQFALLAVINAFVGAMVGLERTIVPLMAKSKFGLESAFAASQAGLVKNLNDGVVWGLLPLFLAEKGLPVDQIGAIAAIYPGIWGISQLITGPLSDHLGRKWMIAVGMWLQATGIALLAILPGFNELIGAAVVLGLGAGLVYPTLLAAVSDVARPDWRATALGVYRLWRDGGYAVGGLAAGLLADAFGIPTTILAIAALTFLSGLVVASVMYETLPALVH